MAHKGLADGSIGILIGAFGLVELKPQPLVQTTVMVGFARVSCPGLNDLSKCVILERVRSSSLEFRLDRQGCYFVFLLF